MWGVEVLLTMVIAASPVKSSSEATVKIANEKSPITKRACAYWEWVAGRAEDGHWNIVASSRHSRAAVTLVVDAEAIEVPLSRLRLHLEPAHRAEAKSLDALPSAAQKDGVEASELPLTVAEFCLEPGRTYYVRHATEKKTPVVHVSDRPFEGGETATALTPRYQAWSH